MGKLKFGGKNIREIKGLFFRVSWTRDFTIFEINCFGDDNLPIGTGILAFVDEYMSSQKYINVSAAYL